MTVPQRREAAAIEAVSRAVYDLAQEHISVLGANVGVVANGVMRLSLTEAISIALAAADAEEFSAAPPKENDG